MEKSGGPSGGEPSGGGPSGRGPSGEEPSGQSGKNPPEEKKKVRKEHAIPEE